MSVACVTSEGFVVGADIGGTSLKAGAFSLAGELLAERHAELEPRHREPAGTLDLLGDLVSSWREAPPPGANGPPRALGVGLPGILDQRTGIIRAAPQFPAWTDFPLRDELTRRLALPVGLDNDVNTIAWGELWQGAARGEERFLMLAIGTGLGGAWAVNGRVQSGAHGMAGEFGHMTVVSPAGRSCGCGKQGCLEAYVSQVGLRHTVDTHPDAAFRALFDDIPWRRRPERLADLVRARNAGAVAVLDDMAFHLGVAIGNLLNIFDVELVLVGGGMGRLLPLMAASLRRAIEAHSFAAIAERARVVQAGLDTRGGMIGGARLALLALAHFQGEVDGRRKPAAQ